MIHTSVPDIVAFYSQTVYLADGTAAWIEAVERGLTTAYSGRATRRMGAEAMLAGNSWDSIAVCMWELMEERLRATAGSTWG